MKAIRAHEWCGPRDLKLDEIDVPEPRKGEVLIRVNAAALNFPDILIIKGTYQVKPPLPFSPGFEIAGTIEKVGPEADGFQPGDRVMAQLGQGGFAEYAIAQTVTVKKVPEPLTDEEAAAFPLVYQTSYFALAYRAQMQKGETVLVHSAAGGVGLSAVQIAKALGAGKIIATVGSDDKKEVVRENGADVVLNYRNEDFVEVTKRETNGKGADIIYDPVGGEVGERSTKCIAFEGRLLIIGFTSGKFSNFTSNHILIKNYSVVGLHWGNYRMYNPAKIEQAWGELFDLVRAGKLKPVIGGRYKMNQVADAMEFLSSRQAVGKIVLTW
jgi:NADPH2:quinone reductase